MPNVTLVVIFKVNHSKMFSTKRHNHINGIEGFWSYAKHKLYNLAEYQESISRYT